jgi:hypothetical protein
MDMKLLGPLVIFGISTSGLAQVRLAISVKGKAVGYARASSKILPDGGKHSDMVMSLTNGTHKMEIRMESAFDKDGRALRQYKTSLMDGKVDSRMLVTVSEVKTTVVNLPAGRGPNKVIPNPEGKWPTEPDEFFFVRDHPGIGARFRSCTFNMEKMRWDVVDGRYEKDEDLEIRGHKFKTHKITAKIGDSPSNVEVYEDEQGLPVRITEGDLVMERVF